jgi:MOSC domain-containing protein YiiM
VLTDTGDTPTVVAIHIAPATRLPTRSVTSVVAEAGKGLVGDRYHGTKHRHVTVQSATSLAAAAVALGRPVDPGLTRRNLTLSGGDVPTTPGVRLRVGGALLEVVRVAAPCRLLDDTLGPGAQEALRRRAGTVFRVLETGTIRVGDAVVAEEG